MRKYDDEFIEYWGEIFTANPSLFKHGIQFEVFLQAPADILQAHVYSRVFDESEDFQPLLKAQRETAARVAAVDSFAVIGAEYEAQLISHIECEQRGDRLVEPMRHHSYSVSRGPKKIREGGVF